MVKKKKVEETFIEAEEFQGVETHELIVAEVKEPVENIVFTHSALSVLKNDDNSYSVVQIKFNPKKKSVSQVIETLETNTDLFIVQERISVLLYDIHNSIME